MKTKIPQITSFNKYVVKHFSICRFKIIQECYCMDSAAILSMVALSHILSCLFSWKRLWRVVFNGKNKYVCLLLVFRIKDATTSQVLYNTVVRDASSPGFVDMADWSLVNISLAGVDLNRQFYVSFSI